MKETPVKKAARTKFLTPLKAILMTALVFYLALVVYGYFGVTDVWGWLREILMLLGVFVLVILAAAGVVGLIMLVRKKSGDI